MRIIEVFALSYFFSIINTALFFIEDLTGTTPFYFHQFSANSGDNFEVVCSNCLSSSTGLQVKFELYKSGDNLAFSSNILEESIQYLRYAVQQTTSYFIRVIKSGGDTSDQYCIKYSFNGVQQPTDICSQIRRHILSPPSIGSFIKMTQSNQYCGFQIQYSGSQASITFSTLDYSEYQSYGSQISDRNKTIFTQRMDDPQLSTQYFLWINMAPPIYGSQNFVIKISGNDQFYWDQEENRCRMPCADDQYWDQDAIQCKMIEPQEQIIIDDQTNSDPDPVVDDSNIGIIAGAAGGAVLIIVGISIFVYCRFCKKKLQNIPQQSPTKTHIFQKQDHRPSRMQQNTIQPHKMQQNKMQQNLPMNNLYSRDYQTNRNDNQFVGSKNIAEISNSPSLRKKRIKNKGKKIDSNQLDQNNSLMCPVCLNINCNETLACGHHAHVTCLAEWFKRNTNCPSCAENIDTNNNKDYDGQVSNPYRQEPIEIAVKNKRTE